MTDSLNQDLDFYELKQFLEIFHDSEVYGGRVAYFKNPTMKERVALFPSGKMTSVGTRSEQEAYEELISTMEFLVAKEIVKPVKLKPTTQNIVLRADFEKSINLEEFAKNSRKNSQAKKSSSHTSRQKTYSSSKQEDEIHSFYATTWQSRHLRQLPSLLQQQTKTYNLPPP